MIVTWQCQRAVYRSNCCAFERSVIMGWEARTFHALSQSWSDKLGGKLGGGFLSIVRRIMSLEEEQ